MQDLITAQQDLRELTFEDPFGVAPVAIPLPRIVFEKGSALLARSEVAKLDTLGEILAQRQFYEVSVRLWDYWQDKARVDVPAALAQERLDGIISYLLTTYGIALDRIEHTPRAQPVRSTPAFKNADNRAMRVFSSGRNDVWMELLVAPREAAPAPLDVVPELGVLTAFPAQNGVPVLRTLDRVHQIDGQSTVAFWLQPEMPQDPSRNHVVMALTYVNVGATSLFQSVLLTPEMDGLIVQDGASGVVKVIDFAFEPGVMRHIALRFEGQNATLIVDGSEFTSFDFPSPAGRFNQIVLAPLAGQPSGYAGHIGRVRVHDAAVSSDAVTAMMYTDKSGYPEENGFSVLSSVVDSRLVLMDDKGEFRSSPKSVTPPSGIWMLAGSHQYQIRQQHVLTGSMLLDAQGEPVAEGKRITSFQGVRSHHLEDFRKRKHRDVAGQDELFSTYPMYSIRIEPALAQPFQLLAGRATANRERIITTTFNDHLIGMRATSSLKSLSSVSLEFAQSDTITLGNPQGGGTNIGKLAADEDIIGLHVEILQATGGIRNISPVSTNYVRRTLGYSGGDKAVVRDTLWLPDGVNFEGLEAHFDDQGVMVGIGIASAFTGDGRSVVITPELGKSVRYRQSGKNSFYRITKANGVQLGDRLFLNDNNTIEVSGLPGYLVPAPLHNFGGSEGADDFGNIFIAQAKAVNAEANFKSYDVTKMDPVHMLENGTGEMVFAMPATDSTDYYDAGRIIIPRGVQFKPEFTGQRFTQTHLIETAQDYRHATGQSVGFSGGPPQATFGLSYSHNRAVQHLVNERKTMALGLTRVMLYDLILDKAEMPLSDAFRQSILQLKTSGLSGLDEERFIRRFGTHYPTAVVYGGMGVHEMEFTSSDISKIIAEDSNWGASIHSSAAKVAGQAEKGGVGAQGSLSNSTSQTLKSVIEDQADRFYWVGGAQGGEGFGVGLDGVVPVYIDLRPLHELLRPPYFTDPAIVHGVRNKLRRNTDRYLAAAEKELVISQSNMPHFYQLELASVRVLPPAQMRPAPPPSFDFGSKDVAPTTENTPLTSSNTASEADGTLDLRGSVKSVASGQNGRAPANLIGGKNNFWLPGKSSVSSNDEEFELGVDDAEYTFDRSTAPRDEKLIQTYSVDVQKIADGKLTVNVDLTEYDDLTDDDRYRGTFSFPWADFPVTGDKDYVFYLGDQEEADVMVFSFKARRIDALSFWSN